MFDIVNHVINITASFYCFYDFVCQIPSDLFNHVVRPNCLLVTMTKCHFAGRVCKYGMSTIFTTTLHVIRLYIPTRALCSYGFVSHGQNVSRTLSKLKTTQVIIVHHVVRMTAFTTKSKSRLFWSLSRHEVIIRSRRRQLRRRHRLYVSK